jgi:hypothetical protein
MLGVYINGYSESSKTPEYTVHSFQVPGAYTVSPHCTDIAHPV